MGQAKATVMIVSLSAGSVPWCFSYAQLAWPDEDDLRCLIALVFWWMRAGAAASSKQRQQRQQRPNLSTCVPPRQCDCSVQWIAEREREIFCPRQIERDMLD
jgi:hypothetical protein